MIKNFNEKNCKILILFKKEPLGKTETLQEAKQDTNGKSSLYNLHLLQTVNLA